MVGTHAASPSFPLQYLVASTTGFAAVQTFAVHLVFSMQHSPMVHVFVAQNFASYVAFTANLT
jgi:hypothetical protein